MKKDTFNIYDSSGLKLLFQLRSGLSPLRSHKYCHKFIDTPSNHCVCLTGAETTTHCSFECPIYNEIRNDLMDSINPLLFLNDLENTENDGLNKNISLW